MKTYIYVGILFYAMNNFSTEIESKNLNVHILYYCIYKMFRV